MLDSSALERTVTSHPDPAPQPAADADKKRTLSRKPPASDTEGRLNIHVYIYICCYLYYTDLLTVLCTTSKVEYSGAFMYCTSGKIFHHLIFCAFVKLMITTQSKVLYA